MDLVDCADSEPSLSFLAEEQGQTQDRPMMSLRRSCETCRYSKSRCCPSLIDSRRCKRCLKDGKDCVFLEAKPRPKRIKTSKTRVAEMEQKLDGIFALLSANNHHGPNADTDQLDISLFPASVPKYQVDPALVRQRPLRVSEPFRVSDAFQPYEPSPLPWLKSPEILDVVGKGIISSDKAESLLRDYGTHSPNFPFVVIQPHCTLEHLRNEKPFLLLSIFSVCARSDMALQGRLEGELRETLARKVIVNGEKSLDLVQGLLVYLCWYHHFYEPQTQQIYQLSQMLISMAVELGITRPDRKGVTGLCSPTAGHPLGISLIQRFYSDLEATRTFLGCYYLSSSLANAFRKPSNLKYTDYVEQCVQTLVEANDAQTDRLLPYFIRVQRLCEEINTTFDYDGHQQLPPLDAIRIEMLTKSFNRQLKQFKETLPTEVWETVAIRMAFHNIQISIYEISLHATRPQKAGAADGLGGPSATDWYSSVARTDALISCVESAKKYLDQFLALTDDDIHQHTITEEMRLVYATLVLSRFATGVSSPYVDPAFLRSTANIEHYITGLLDRISSFITVLDNGHEHMDFYWHFKRLFQIAKGWFVEQLRSGQFSTLEATGLADCSGHTGSESIPMPHEVLAVIASTDPMADPDWFPNQDNQSWETAFLEGYPTPTLDPQMMNLGALMQ